MKNIIYTLLMLPGFIYSQVNGYYQNFNDTTITGWVSDHPRTFQLTADSSALKINYTRTAASDMWDNFNFTPAQKINIANTKRITVRVKSTVGCALSFKSVFDSGEQFLTKNIIGDNEWHIIAFEYNNPASYAINKMYVYLDGGLSMLKSGVVYFDDARFGDSAFVVADNSALVRATGLVSKLLLNSIEGNQEGQFPVDSKATLQSALANAQLFIPSNDQKIINNAVWICLTLPQHLKKMLQHFP